MKYLRVDIEGCVIGCCSEPIYTALDGLTEYTDKDLVEIGQDIVNEQHSWGYEVVDENEVPENER